ncbi:MAG: DUF805 domain-containing protein [Actinomycetota bacterium]|jgi:uncharacterized membrane protein YhaH (DUF805 family)
MKFQHAVKSGFSNYANFKGRASRSEFWWWTLFTVIISSAVSGYSALDSLVTAGFLLPTIAMGCRRMHDLGRRGWWQLIPIVSFIFACQKSSEEMNQYGPPPAPTTL